MPNEFHNNPDEDTQGSQDNYDWTEMVSEIVVGKEYETDKSNMDREHDDLEAVMDMLICERSEKDYDWQSDIFIPDFPSIHWTQIGEAVSQYFGRWEKVDCPATTNDPIDPLKSKAAKDFINYHLNQPYLHYLQKFIRLHSFNRLAGWAVVKFWYESDVTFEQVQVGTQQVPIPTGQDIYGNPASESPYPEQIQVIEEPIYDQVKQINLDRPNFDIWPNQDVYMDNKYVYSLQDKDHVIFRSEEKLSKLISAAGTNLYINLDQLRQDTETDTEQDTYNKQSEAGDKYDRIIQKFDPDVEILERWGKWPVIPQEDGQVISGIDDNGDINPESQFIEMTITVANIKSKKVLIRFQPNMYGFRPMTRFLCYVHPTKDRGIGDGRYARELQIAINDTFNMNNDRTRMATFPTIKKRKYSEVDNDTLQFGPEHVMELVNMDDVDIIEISDDIQGGLVQQEMLSRKMQQVLAKWTHDMGGFPAKKQPVTTTMLAEQKSNIRDNLVNLTVEHTGLQEFYSMILRMSGQFMQPETLQSILAQDAIFFDPNPDYNFVPVSTAILSEHAKESKIQDLTQMLSLLVNVPNPQTFAIINLIVAEIFELMGKEEAHYGQFLLDPNAPHPQIIEIMTKAQAALAGLQRTEQGGNGGGQGGSPRRLNRPKPQNQSGNPQSRLEQGARRTGTRAGGGRT
jgi:hypothetical protein